VDSELQDLERQLDMLHSAGLAEELRGRTKDMFGTPGFGNAGGSTAEWSDHAAAETSESHARLKRVGDVADGIGKYAAKWTTGPFAQSARVGSATAARGSQAHQVVYNFGKFFGKTFKPWGAVNAARMIGIVGRVVGILGGLLALGAQVAEDKRQEQNRVQLLESRASLRMAYRESVREIEKEFWESYEKFAQDFYGCELEAVDSLLSDLKGQREGRTEAVSLFRSIETELRELIQRMQTEVTYG
jgi:hypothetical protein